MWAHFPSVLRSLVGGIRRIELEQDLSGFFLVERSWWFGETRHFRYNLIPDSHIGGFKWAWRLEREKGKAVNPASERAAWNDLIVYDDRDGFEGNAVPFRFNLR